ncbi:GNAT family N-acetyltransferase [Photobacterium leiognathi]|uniref:GNAT family N-acetyltransferase n=1 Tax=Photobacterium leiognathi TaxID=553611 RepID=UPI0029820B03|nr:GNAT family N-acetyltransferase [Photobacterium leiognathi]
MKLDFELSTPRLTLRPFKNADLSDFLTAVHESTADLSPWLEWCDERFDQHDAHEWINASRLSWQTDFSYEFAIFNRFNDEFLGTVSLSAIIPMTNSANLGYWIRSSYHQQGFATEANTAAVQFAFQMLGLTRLEIVTHIDNYASQKTAKACNAQFECKARNRIFYHNKPLDGLVFSLIPTDLMV